MATTAEELLVAIRSDGVSETQDDLEGVEQTMDETAQSAGESADQLEGFSTEFQGAMTAAVAALAIGAAGLLSQVPVIGESFGALGAVVDAFLFRIDGLLRPGLSVINELLFGFAGVVFEAEGALGFLFDTVSLLVPLLAAGGAFVLGIAKAGAALSVWASTGAGVVAILTKIVAVIGTVIGAIVSLPATLLAAIAAVVAFAAAYALNIGGIRDATNSVLSKVYQAFLSLLDNLISWASELGTKAYQWGADVVDQMIAGIKNALSRLRGVLNDIGGTIESTIGIDVSDFTGGGGGGGGGGRPSGGLFGGGGGGISLDGRQLSESTGRYRADPSRRRGI